MKTYGGKFVKKALVVAGFVAAFLLGVAFSGFVYERKGHWCTNVTPGTTYTVTSAQRFGEVMYLTIRCDKGKPNAESHREAICPYALPYGSFLHPKMDGTQLTVTQEQGHGPFNKNIYKLE